MYGKIAQFGNIDPPPGIGSIGGGGVAGIPTLINIVIKSLIVISFTYAIVNLVLAGFWYMTAAGDPKRIGDATAKIWQTVIGVVVSAGAVMLGGLIGELFLGGSDVILNFKIFTPGP